MTEYGYVITKVFTSRGEIPISDASVVVVTADGGEVLGARITDSNGKTAPVMVETPSVEMSESPNNGIPFASVNLRISHPDYYTYYVRDAQVFSGQTSVQQAELIPLEENATTPFTLREFFVTPQNL